MVIRLLLGALSAALLTTSSIVLAQDNGDGPPLEILTPKRGEPTTTEPPPPADPPPEEAEASPAEENNPLDTLTVGRGPVVSSGLGAGAIFWFTDGSAQPISAAIVFEGRGFFPINDVVGFEWIGRMEVHDFATIWDIWCWYGEGTRDDVASKITLLWPGLFIAPLLASNYTGGVGLAIYPTPGVPAFFVDFGVQSSLYLRISDCDFLLDLGFGAYAGLGADISDSFGFTLRAVYGAPFFNSTVDREDQHILSTSLTLNWLH